MSSSPPVAESGNQPKLRRVLGLWDLVLLGIILIQPTAPMPIFGVVYQEGQGHVVTAILIAMVAMMFTAVSYGRMARAYPSAGSAFTYVGRELHPGLGYVTGWSMAMDYMLNPLICFIWSAKAAANVLPEVPYGVWVLFFAILFTGLNLRGIKSTTRTNQVLGIGMGVVIVIFFVAAARYILGVPQRGLEFFVRPFYNPETFKLSTVLTATSIASLTYIGFDGLSTLSEEVHNPRKNILRATVLVCLITGILASLEVYAAQLVWPNPQFPDVDTAFSFVAGRAGGAWLFQLVNFTLLVATMGSGMGTQLAAARLLYGMGRDNALPKKFFGAIDPKTHIPRNNVLFVGAIALAGAYALSYQFGAELLNFGAFIAFMGVNAAAFVRYYLRENEKRLTNLIPPVIGFAMCLYIWLNLRTPAKIAGGIWLIAGVLYGAYKTKGFRKNLVSFEVPAD
jgi:putrescine importer